MIKYHFFNAIHFNLSSIQDQAEPSSSIRLEMALKNRWEGPEISMKIIDFSVNLTLTHSMSMGSSFWMGNTYYSNHQKSSILLHRNMFNSIPIIVVKQEKLNSLVHLRLITLYFGIYFWSLLFIWVINWNQVTKSQVICYSEIFCILF